VIGGFAKGHYTPATSEALSKVYSVAGESLGAHVIVSRMIYELEKKMNIG